MSLLLSGTTCIGKTNHTKISQSSRSKFQKTNDNMRKKNPGIPSRPTVGRKQPRALHEIPQLPATPSASSQFSTGSSSTSNQNINLSTETNRTKTVQQRPQNKSKDSSIDAILFGNGQTVHSIKFEKGKWYGTSNWTGGAESYHPVVESSISVYWDRIRMEKFRTKKITPQTKDVQRYIHIPEVRKTRSCDAFGDILVGADKGNIFLGHVKRFCRTHAGVAVIFRRVGFRNENPLLQEHLLISSFLLHPWSLQFDCVAGAIVNAIQFFVNQQRLSAVVEQLKSCTTQFDKLGSAGAHIRTLGLKLNVKKPSNIKQITVTTKKYKEAFEIIASFQDGIWLVRVCHDDKSLRPLRCYQQS